MRLIRKLGLVLTVVAIMLMALPGHIALAQSATVSAPSTIDPGASGNASISVSAAEIGAFDLNISTDAGVLNFDSITAGTIPDFFITVYITGPGSASVVGFMTGITPITGGTVANISFTAVGSGGDSHYH